ncbi:MAG TPA: hypothetical protein V6D17_20010 [Candidatus Obscuribacterales bacterium]
MPSYVRAADGDRLVLCCCDSRLAAKLIEIGFSIAAASTDQYEMTITDEDEKIALFSRLKDLGLAFAGGKSWSPAELFELYAEEEKLTYPYMEITWSGPDKWQIREISGTGC